MATWGFVGLSSLLWLFSRIIVFHYFWPMSESHYFMYFVYSACYLWFMNICFTVPLLVSAQRNRKETDTTEWLTLSYLQTCFILKAPNGSLLFIYSLHYCWKTVWGRGEMGEWDTITIPESYLSMWETQF